MLEWIHQLTLRYTTPDIRCRHRRHELDGRIMPDSHRRHRRMQQNCRVLLCRHRRCESDVRFILSVSQLVNVFILKKSTPLQSFYWFVNYTVWAVWHDTVSIHFSLSVRGPTLVLLDTKLSQCLKHDDSTTNVLVIIIIIIIHVVLPKGLALPRSPPVASCAYHPVVLLIGAKIYKKLNNFESCLPLLYILSIQTGKAWYTRNSALIYSILGCNTSIYWPLLEVD